MRTAVRQKKKKKQVSAVFLFVFFPLQQCACKNHFCNFGTCKDLFTSSKHSCSFFFFFSVQRDVQSLNSTEHKWLICNQLVCTIRLLMAFSVCVLQKHYSTEAFPVQRTSLLRIYVMCYHIKGLVLGPSAGARVRCSRSGSPGDSLQLASLLGSFEYLIKLSI